MKIFEFWYKGDQDFVLTVRAKSKAGAFEAARLLSQDPEKWFLTQIRELTDCHIPFGMVEKIPSSEVKPEK